MDQTMISGADMERAFEIQEDLNELVRDLAEYIDAGDRRSERDARAMIKSLNDEKRALFGEPVAEGDTSNQGIHA